MGGKGFVSGLRTKTSPGAWYNPGLLRVSAPWSGGQYGVGDPGFPLISHQNPEAEKGSRTHSSNLRRKKEIHHSSHHLSRSKLISQAERKGAAEAGH